MRYKSSEITALNKIYNATASLIKRKNFSDITISDIIRESKVSRSTFYVYFKSKEQILSQLCNDIFDRVNSEMNKKSSGSIKNNALQLKALLTNSFSLFLIDKDLIIAILNSNSSNVFLSQLRKRIKPLIIELIKYKELGNNDIPEDIKIHQYINGYVALLQYYLRHANNLPPETISDYYFSFYK